MSLARQSGPVSSRWLWLSAIVPRGTGVHTFVHRLCNADGAARFAPGPTAGVTVLLVHFSPPPRSGAGSRRDKPSASGATAVRMTAGCQGDGEGA